uniref:Bridge-like lipid transfer protein family member 1 C-terminal domain-containing protein n=1 Tax=Timema bartmani TaxID=61472 RepID=A0A7R9F0P4_9NEOP|nr:unnamed protein product [Timema bartmani]
MSDGVGRAVGSGPLGPGSWRSGPASLGAWGTRPASLGLSVRAVSRFGAPVLTWALAKVLVVLSSTAEDGEIEVRISVGPSGSVLRAHSPENDCRNKDLVINSSTATDEDRKRKAFDPAEMFTKDWRNYHCKTWHLEPTVRLLSWAGKSIEPYGVDYILQKLGFSHARTTIPKWMQRGFMDPLDKVLAVLMFRMITVVREESSGEADYQANK